MSTTIARKLSLFLQEKLNKSNNLYSIDVRLHKCNNKEYENFKKLLEQNSKSKIIYSSVTSKYFLSSKLTLLELKNIITHSVYKNDTFIITDHTNNKIISIGIIEQDVLKFIEKINSN